MQSIDIDIDGQLSVPQEHPRLEDRLRSDRAHLFYENYEKS
jgi:hypothetical protein